ncbi:MAG TPA: alpha/beta hydrolase [Polyangiaceae bacterium]|nr:alpha/beta hydrolase [Polyangiaceae bacterium]
MTSKIALHVEHYGAGDTLLVLLHGFGGSARNFRPQAKFFGKTRQILLIDQRGHARSEAPAGLSAYEPEEFVEDVRRVVSEHRATKIVLGGISMGATIALRYALAHGASLAGLILAAFPRAGSDGPSSWARAFADAIDADGLDRAGERFVWGGDRFDAASAKWIRQGFLEHPAHALSAILRRVLATQEPVDDLKKNLETLQVPTLVIVGEQDVPSLDASRALARWIPHAELHVIPEAGHVVNLQKSEEFNGLVSNFLRRIEA